MPSSRRIAILLALVCPAGDAIGQSTEQESTDEQRGALAILIRNPDTTDGAPPYALADQFGKVRRLVEPSPQIDLRPHLGGRVRIQHDTGRTLLASQLELPSRPAVEPTTPLRQVSPAQFIPPGRATRIDPRAPDSMDRSHGVVRAQAEEAVDSFGDFATDLPGPSPTASDAATDPINLDDLPPPSVSDSLEPTPAGDYYEELPAVEPIHTGTVHSGHDPDCPHCNQPARQASPPCDCPKCRTKTAPAVGLCKTCGRSEGWCGPTCNPPSRRGVYGRAEYLLWWFDGMSTPPLVTTNDLGNAPIIGDPGTRVVYGGELLDDSRNGLRLTLGGWLDDRRDLAIEGDWTIFETESDSYLFTDPAATGNLGRPFYNIATVDETTGAVGPPAEDVQIISRPGQVGGSLGIHARSEFESFGLRVRTGICCREIGGCGPCGCPSCNGGGLIGARRNTGGGISRIDFIAGYRFAQLQEQLLFQENLTQIASGATLAVNEAFEVDNDFHGLELGFIYDWQRARWGFEFASRIAIGSTAQHVGIRGSNTIGAAGATGITTTGGLLAQSTNIGSYERNRFSVLPELSARLSYRVTPRLSLSAAYTVLYWANVVRPGDQIDFSVDGRLVSPALVAATPNSHPRFLWNETSLWAHGFNFGLDYAY